MKKSLALAIVLSLVMLVTLATPAMAAAPIRTGLYTNSGGTPTDTLVGKVSFQITKDNNLKVNVVLEGLTPGETYYVVSHPSLNLCRWEREFTAKNNGTGRWRGVSNCAHGYSPGTHEFEIKVYQEDNTLLYLTELISITFN